MAHHESILTDRSTVLQAVLATAWALGTAPGLEAQETAPKSSTSILPTRPLGKTGTE